MYVPSYTCTQLLSYAYVPRYTYVPSRYAMISTGTCTLSSYVYVPRYAYLPKDMVTLTATQLRLYMYIPSYAVILKGTLAIPSQARLMF